MRAIVADNNPEVRSALRLLLENKPGIQTVTEVNTYCDLVYQVANSCPDLVLIDSELPGTRPSQLLPILRKLCPHLLIIVLGNRYQIRKEALLAGAKEYISKTESPEKLLKILDRLEVTM